MQILSLRGVDILRPPRRKRNVIVSDIDDTLRQGLILSELCPILNEEAAANINLSEFDRHIDNYLGGDKPSAKFSLEVCMRGLKGVAVGTAEAIARSHLQATRDKLFDFAVTLLKQLSKDTDIYLMTSEPQFVCNAFVDQLAADSIPITGVGNVNFGQENGQFSGFEADISYVNKGVLTDKIKAYYGGHLAVFGDHPNDLVMLEQADQAVVVSSDRNRQFAEEARAIGWSVINS